MSARLPLFLKPLQILGSDAVVPPDPDGRELFLEKRKTISVMPVFVLYVAV